MSSRIVKTMMWLLLAFAASAQAQTVEYLHTDALGSVVAVTNASRTVLERREYEPYGSQLTPAVSNGPGYTGHVQDAATGLVYMQQRYYDASIGRFLSMDPVTVNAGTGANFNRYWYADNNPYTFIDPTGTCTGSRIKNEDGTCRSSGGNTTETYGARQSTENGSDAKGAIYVPQMNDGVFVVLYVPDADQSTMDAIMDGEREGMLAGAPVPPVALGISTLSKLFRVRLLFNSIQFSGKTSRELNLMLGDSQRALIRQFFGQGAKGIQARAANFTVPNGLTRQSLEIYAEIARRAIREGIDKSGVQAGRLRLIQQALDTML